ncbi:MAG: hypothetical protein EZS28_022892 [Streblomastix strix]|uniref:Uncharacterized protein n=1 Tax=Streblomastix strix TaxID=222440 RepID=A0A5J4VGC7_9EUKA|nr:MAG: hypothetical protein EZS28_022892 [Streblomastix strix]
MSNEADFHLLDVLLIHEEILYGNVLHNTICLIDQVINISNQINNINNALAHDVQTRTEANEIFDTKADKSDTYTKTETDTLLDAKADKTELIDSYSKTEDDALLLLKANVADIVDSYSKTQDDALLLLKTNVADIVDSYSKTQDDALLLLKADKTDTYMKPKTDSYSKTETDTLFDAKADKTDTYFNTETYALLDAKADKSELIDSYTKSENNALLLLKANDAHIVDINIEDSDALMLTEPMLQAPFRRYVRLHRLKYPEDEKQVIFTENRRFTETPETVTYISDGTREITYSSVYPRTSLSPLNIQAFVTSEADMERYIQYLSALIIENQERTLDDTHTRFVVIVSMVAIVYRIPLAGRAFPALEKFIKRREVHYIESPYPKIASLKLYRIYQSLIKKEDQDILIEFPKEFNQ